MEKTWDEILEEEMFWLDQEWYDEHWQEQEDIYQVCRD